MTERTDGWPADRGPLKILHELGLVSDPQRRPIWLHYPKVHTTPSGIPTYTATCKFLTQDGLRSLAALTLEGWDVFVRPTANEIEMKVTKP